MRTVYEEHLPLILLYVRFAHPQLNLRLTEKKTCSHGYLDGTFPLDRMGHTKEVSKFMESLGRLAASKNKGENSHLKRL